MGDTNFPVQIQKKKKRKLAKQSIFYTNKLTIFTCIAKKTKFIQLKLLQKNLLYFQYIQVIIEYILKESKLQPVTMKILRKKPEVYLKRDFLMAQSVKNLPAMQETQETWVRSLGWEDPLEEEMNTHSSILAWKISGTEEAGGLHSMGSQRVGHN